MKFFRVCVCVCVLYYAYTGCAVAPFHLERIGNIVSQGYTWGGINRAVTLIDKCTDISLILKKFIIRRH